MSDVVYFPQYSYTGLTGGVYHPHYHNGLWYLVDGHPIRFLDMAALCCIDDDMELSFLKLKYSG